MIRVQDSSAAGIRSLAFLSQAHIDSLILNSRLRCMYSSLYDVPSAMCKVAVRPIPAVCVCVPVEEGASCFLLPAPECRQFLRHNDSIAKTHEHEVCTKFLLFLQPDTLRTSSCNAQRIARSTLPSTPIYIVCKLLMPALHCSVRC